MRAALARCGGARTGLDREQRIEQRQRRERRFDRDDTVHDHGWSEGGTGCDIYQRERRRTAIRPRQPRHAAAAVSSGEANRRGQIAADTDQDSPTDRPGARLDGTTRA